MFPAVPIWNFLSLPRLQQIVFIMFLNLTLEGLELRTNWVNDYLSGSLGLEWKDSAEVLVCHMTDTGLIPSNQYGLLTLPGLVSECRASSIHEHCQMWPEKRQT